MDSAQLLVLIDAGSSLLARLVAAYVALPDKDAEINARLTALSVELDATTELVAGWKRLPPDSPPSS